VHRGQAPVNAAHPEVFGEVELQRLAVLRHAVRAS